MRCYRCNSVLSDSDICESCGTDVVLYKKIVKKSNAYYNMALAKARVRDLSGAADLLRRSVRIDKNNINARNLLGLVYYEMGECVEALSEWVISKNIKPEKNMADEYIKDIQSNPNKLNTLNQTIRKFNKALGYAWEGNDDLAIIQLKKVLNMNPNLIKAYQLLALLYMKKGENNKAKKALMKAAKIDVNNTLTIKYLNEITSMEEAEGSKKNSKKEEKEEKPLSGNDVIIPEGSYKETNYTLVTFINVLIGIVIGAAMIYFLVTPAKESETAAEYKVTITDYASKLDAANGKVNSLTKELEEAISQRDKYKTEAESAAGIVANSQNVEVVVSMANKVIAMEKPEEMSNEDAIAIADSLAVIDVSGESEELKNLYNYVAGYTFEKAALYYFNMGAQYSNNSDWENAIVAYEHCVNINDQEPAYLYKLGKSIYMKNGNQLTEESRIYFEKCIQIAPNSEYAGYSANYLN